ncbi:hypothetical protein Htur_4224 (plasmid) [Haloterrigena turkmenica DSM 5511]|uniref:Inner membrane protein YgaP-like transmembrane domain-containing protein n=1 Tax=Haloterrigena turkmenica (strain ATCC 51198 / DSM 5511 / JCM 9101 / NCIMB 13204 / VKM B-1734 / 4k) TaxID=543526 RepID=D2S0Z7_HALTV|nr:DUF2892 domain-containing protein [Haloterrigena turkmenica]ADB63044.1 hypothetical protein Htur_4224 [Haloterrigena turkmenica DSM 5511]
MQKNVGGYDRGARFVFGPLLAIIGIAALGGLISLAAGTVGFALAAIALVVGAVLTITAVTQKCPMNGLLGIDTYRGGVESRSEGGRDENRRAGRLS